MSNVLIIVERFYPEDFLVNDLVSEWIKLGDNLEVLTQVPSYPFDKIFDGYKNRTYQTNKEVLPSSEGDNNGQEVLVHRVSTIFGYNRSVKRKVLNYLHFAWLTFLWVLWNGRKYDRIFVYHTAALTMATGVLPLKWIWRKPISIWTQDLWPDAVWGFGFKPNKLKVTLLNSFVRIIYSCCDRIMVSCRGFVVRIKELTGRDAEFVPQWDTMPDDVFAEDNNKQRKDTDPVIFMFAGNLGKPQNLDNVLSGFAEFQAYQVFSGKRCELWFVGGGVMLEPLQARVKTEKIPNVYFKGRQPKSEMAQWYKKADVLIISLTSEYSLTLPGKFQSYIKTGKALLGILKGDAREMIEENGLGQVAEPDDIKSIAQGFVLSYNGVLSGETRNSGIRARKLSAEEFNRTLLIGKLVVAR